MDVITLIVEYFSQIASFELLGYVYEFSYFWFGVILGVIGFIISSIFVFMLKRNISSAASISQISPANLIITAPIVEEMIFRLVLISIFAIFFDSVVIAIVLSAILFAIGHTFIQGGYGFMRTFIFGLIIGWAFINFGVGVCIIAHMTNNTLDVVI